jgi:hypothetical protein
MTTVESGGHADPSCLKLRSTAWSVPAANAAALLKRNSAHASTLVLSVAWPRYGKRNQIGTGDLSVAEIAIELRRQFQVGVTATQAFELLADVPRSVGHFPKLRQLVNLGGNAYRWEMEPMGTAGISHQVVYACHYQPDPQRHTVSWRPVPKIGNGRIQGQWALTSLASGTAIAFHTHGALDVPVPRLLKSVAEPFVTGEFTRSVDTYISRLCETLGGRTG